MSTGACAGSSETKRRQEIVLPPALGQDIRVIYSGWSHAVSAWRLGYCSVLQPYAMGIKNRPLRIRRTILPLFRLIQCKLFPPFRLAHSKQKLNPNKSPTRFTFQCRVKFRVQLPINRRSVCAADSGGASSQATLTYRVKIYPIAGL